MAFALPLLVFLLFKLLGGSMSAIEVFKAIFLIKFIVHLPLRVLDGCVRAFATFMHHPLQCMNQQDNN